MALESLSVRKADKRQIWSMTPISIRP